MSARACNECGAPASDSAATCEACGGELEPHRLHEDSDVRVESSRIGDALPNAGGGSEGRWARVSDRPEPYSPDSDVAQLVNVPPAPATPGSGRDATAKISEQARAETVGRSASSPPQSRPAAPTHPKPDHASATSTSRSDDASTIVAKDGVAISPRSAIPPPEVGVPTDAAEPGAQAVASTSAMRRSPTPEASSTAAGERPSRGHSEPHKLERAAQAEALPWNQRDQPQATATARSSDATSAEAAPHRSGDTTLAVHASTVAAELAAAAAPSEGPASAPASPRATHAIGAETKVAAASATDTTAAATAAAAAQASTSTPATSTLSRVAAEQSQDDPSQHAGMGAQDVATRLDATPTPTPTPKTDNDIAVAPVPPAAPRPSPQPSGPTPTGSQVIARRPPVLASEALLRDIAPSRPARYALRIWCPVLGLLGAVNAWFLTRGEGMGWPLAGAFCALSLLGLPPMPYSGRASAVATVSATAMALLFWSDAPSEGGGSRFMLTVAVNLLATGLLFRAWHRASAVARFIVASGIALASLYLWLGGELQLLTLTDVAWQSWLPRVMSLSFCLLLLLSLLAFMDARSTGAASVWAAFVLIWHGIHAAVTIVGAAWPKGAPEFDLSRVPPAALLAWTSIPLLTALLSLGLAQLLAAGLAGAAQRHNTTSMRPPPNDLRRLSPAPRGSHH